MIILLIVILGIRFISSTSQPLLPDKDKKSSETEDSKNKDEIDIDDDSEDEEQGNTADVKLTKQAIPSAVFGKLDKENED